MHDCEILYTYRYTLHKGFHLNELSEYFPRISIGGLFSLKKNHITNTIVMELHVIISL